ncbi:hypothetical protein [Streptomyces sp. NPDC005336]|uniref:hypothetical protein n=1 Tax=unclassified Streptomyces TaxID=2593676 RepID=UPI0033AEA094
MSGESEAEDGGATEAARAAVVEGRSETYRGHAIFLPADDRHRKVFVDGRPVRYGRIGDAFYLDVYAYDPGASPVDVVRRYIDHLELVRRHDDEGH